MAFRAYIAVAKTALSEAIAYRASLIEWTLFNVFDFAPFMMIWMVALNNKTVQGFDVATIFTYYMGAFLLYTYVYTHVWWGILEDIRNGTLSAHLVRPISYLRSHSVRKISAKLLDIGLTLLVLLPLVIIFRNLLVMPESVTSIAVAFLAATLAITLFMSISYIMAMTAFWFDDAQGVMALFWATDAVLSGTVAPIALLPQWLQTISAWSPFRFFISFPMEIFLERLSTQEIFVGFLHLFGWILAMHIARRVVWSQGLKRYSAVGM